MDTTNLKSFSYMEDGSIEHSILSINETTNKLKSGFYELKAIQEQWNYIPKLSLKNINILENDCIDYKELIDFNRYLDYFLKEDIKNKIEDLGFVHKLGAILYGKQGTGKTVVSSCIASKIIEHGGIAINIDTSSINGISALLNFLKDLRKVHTEKMLFIFDEAESVLKEKESVFKNFLDGFNSINNSISIFTTNYLEQIPKAIYERPSRIRFSIELKGISDEGIIHNMIKSNLNRVPTKEELKNLMGCTIDEIKEFILNEIMGVKEGTNKKNSIGFNNK